MLLIVEEQNGKYLLNHLSNMPFQGETMQSVGVRPRRAKLNRFVKYGCILIGGSLAAILLFECVLRLLYPPHNFLTPNVSHHESLGYHIKPFHAGHDAWGFRNQTIPAEVDTVVIGDSFAYGVSVSARDAWPEVLASNVALPIYNLSVGGYGVRQYQYLLETYATQLSPRQVIISLYLGDDIAVKPPHFNRGNNQEKSSDQYRFNLRRWLASNSFLYHVIVQSAVGDWIRLVENWWLTNESSSERYIYFDNTANRTIFTPKPRLKNLDLSRERNQIGLTALKSIILEMERFSASKNMAFKVVVFPTKERVYKEHYLSVGNENYPIMNQLFSAEDEVRKQLTRFLYEHQIAHLDLLESLVQENRKSKLFFQDANGHMAREGHKVAAKRIADELY
ncbi:SGNH/GDSL hydrolase family protein [Vibrio sp. PNB22_4_2]